MDRIEALAKLTFEDPKRAAVEADQIHDPTAYGPHGCGIIGTAYRLADRRVAADSVFKSGATLHAPDFEIADLCWHAALLEFDRQNWIAGHKLLDIALWLHGPIGLPGPLDFGLPAILAVRGMFLYARCAAEPGRDRLELLEARADVRRALDLIPDPRAAPRTYLSAILTLAHIAMERGGGYVEAQGLLSQARTQLRRMGIARKSVTGARIDWASALVGAALDGELDEAREALLLGARETLHARGAHIDGARCGIDLALCYLERDEPPWPKLEELALDAYLVLPLCGDAPEAASALLLWREAIQARAVTPAVLGQIAGHVQGTVRPDPALHATTDEWEPLDSDLLRRVKPWEIAKPRAVRRRIA